MQRRERRIRMKDHTKKISQMIVVCMVIVFLFVIAYFTVFEATHMVHDCQGENCPICHELHVAELFTNQLTAIGIVTVSGLIAAVFVKKTGIVSPCSYSERNLVIDKVRIDD